MTTLLVAVAEPRMRVLDSAMVPTNGYCGLEAAHGDETWWLIRRERPDLALLDFVMPGLHRLDLTRAIQAEPSLRGTRSSS